MLVSSEKGPEFSWTSDSVMHKGWVNVFAVWPGSIWWWSDK